MKIDNQVIKVLNKEHGKKVLGYWKSQGAIVDTYAGDMTEEDDCSCIYYGIIDGEFSNYGIKTVIKYNAKIIELPKIEENEKVVTMSRDFLDDAYKAASVETRNKIRGNVNSWDLTTTDHFVKEMYKKYEHCTEWSNKIKKQFPNLFKEDWRDKVVEGRDMHCITRNADAKYHVIPSVTLGYKENFKTKDEAELVKNKLELLIDMSNFACIKNNGWIPKWSDELSLNYGIILPTSKILITSQKYETNEFIFGISFKTEAIAKEAIDEFGERIKKYYNTQF